MEIDCSNELVGKKVEEVTLLSIYHSITISKN